MPNTETNGDSRVRVADPTIVEAAKKLLKGKLLICDFCDKRAIGWEFAFMGTPYMWVYCHKHARKMYKDKWYGKWPPPSPYNLRVKPSETFAQKDTCAS